MLLAAGLDGGRRLRGMRARAGRGQRSRAGAQSELARAAASRPQRWAMPSPTALRATWPEALPAALKVPAEPDVAYPIAVGAASACRRASPLAPDPGGFRDGVRRDPGLGSRAARPHRPDRTASASSSARLVPAARASRRTWPTVAGIDGLGAPAACRSDHRRPCTTKPCIRGCSAHEHNRAMDPCASASGGRSAPARRRSWSRLCKRLARHPRDRGHHQRHLHQGGCRDPGPRRRAAARPHPGGRDGRLPPYGDPRGRLDQPRGDRRPEPKRFPAPRPRS